MKVIVYHNQDHPETGEMGFDRMFIEIPDASEFVKTKSAAAKKGWVYFSHEELPGMNVIAVQFYRRSEGQQASVSTDS